MDARRSRRCPLALLLLGAVGLIPTGARAAVPAAPEAAQAAAAPPLEAVVHGVYLEMRVGPGIEVKGSTIPPTAAFPQLTGQDEMYGAGGLADLAVGYELNDRVALQLVGGLQLAAGRRDDRVRGLDVLFGALGVRLAVPLAERLVLNLAPSVGYARSDNAVEPPTAGVVVAGSVGAEYFVHVRHVSVGADLTCLVPLSPLRAFVGLVPHVRYTF